MSAVMSSTNPSNTEPEVSRSVRKRYLQVAITVLVQAVILFISSGRSDWMMAWFYLGVEICVIVITGIVILPRNPELIAERATVKENAKAWDKWIGGLAISCLAVVLLVAGFDERFTWSPPMGLGLQIVAMVALILGRGLFGWAMASNKFFSGVVRIQKDRGHHVATAGPYRYVRHPGYTGYLATAFATPVMLGSLWALIPAGLSMGLMIVRTTLEDRTLQNELAGYEEFAGKVRYRLVPGIW